MRNRTFVRTASDGRVDSAAFGDTGLYYRGARFISRLDLTIGGVAPRLLDSEVDDDDFSLVIDLANPDLELEAGLVPADTIHLCRRLIVDDGILAERLDVTNYGRSRAEFEVAYTASADFADLFEARGMQRAQRGRSHAAKVEDGHLLLTYDGLDGVHRQTRLLMTPDATAHNEGFILHIVLDPGESRSFELRIGCSVDGSSVDLSVFTQALSSRRSGLKCRRRESACIDTSSEFFNAWIDRSRFDLDMLTIETEHGLYPAAGAPWYVTPFGRDGIITSLQMLDIQPNLAAGVLRFLAAHQATEEDPTMEAQPGKIVHEMREGEMANLGEHRFARYYGTVDATPLFLMLAGAYFRRTADLDLIHGIWPNILAAWRWIDEYGDMDGDGFIEYESSPGRGLIHQGWKDSSNAVAHEDGSEARGPIALCEVQGYVYAGKLAVAALADASGDASLAAALRQQADTLRDQFNQLFWDDELGSFVLALDGDKQPCRVVSSNAGHSLYTGIAEPELAARQVERFRSADIFSGWGLRTLSRDSAWYNPLSYHNGSIWPHDNALVAAGFARYGFRGDMSQMLDDAQAAAVRTPSMRLPELYGGFEREPVGGPNRGPVRYPISCTPQAWAAGSVFMLLSACLGIQIDAPRSRIVIENPTLPSGRTDRIDVINVSSLRVADSVLNLSFSQDKGEIAVTSEQQSGPRIDFQVV